MRELQARRFRQIFFCSKGRFLGAESREYRRFVRRCGKGITVVLLDDAARNYCCLVGRSCSGRRARPSSSPELLQPRRDRFRRRIPICCVFARWIGLPLVFRLGRFRWLSRTRCGHLRWGRFHGKLWCVGVFLAGVGCGGLLNFDAESFFADASAVGGNDIFCIVGGFGFLSAHEAESCFIRGVLCRNKRKTSHNSFAMNFLGPWVLS